MVLERVTQSSKRSSGRETQGIAFNGGRTNYVNMYMTKVVPKRLHDHETIKEAQQKELEKFQDYEAEEVVDGLGKETQNSKWVATKIKIDKKGNKSKGFKARLCMRGDQEVGHDLVQRDLPIVLKSTIKLFLHMAAQENWNLKCGYIKQAYLQGKDLDRDIFVIAPEEAGVMYGKVWKLTKAVYGIGDGSRKFYLALKEKKQSTKP